MSDIPNVNVNALCEQQQQQQQKSTKGRNLFRMCPGHLSVCLSVCLSIYKISVNRKTENDSASTGLCLVNESNNNHNSNNNHYNSHNSNNGNLQSTYPAAQSAEQT